MKQELVSVHDGEDQRIFSWSNALIALPKRPPEVSDMRRVQDTAIAHAKKLGTGVGVALLAIVPECVPRASTVTPSAEFSAMFETIKGRVSGFALVVDIAPFANASVRAAVSGLVLLSRTPVPFKAFSSMSDAASWLGTTLRESGQRAPESSALEGALERAAFDFRGARAASR